MTLEEVLAGPSPLPEPFLILRRMAMEQACLHEPIPELPEWPGVYKPPVKGTILHAPHDGYARAMKGLRRSIARAQGPKKPAGKGLNQAARGDVPLGAKVKSGVHYITVLAFCPAGQDPEQFIPRGTKTTNLGGHKHHGPCAVDRYVGLAHQGNKPIYHFPKAETIEKQYDMREMLV